VTKSQRLLIEKKREKNNNSGDTQTVDVAQKKYHIYDVGVLETLSDKPVTQCTPFVEPTRPRCVAQVTRCRPVCTRNR
jgi:hypothetical protein